MDGGRRDGDMSIEPTGFPHMTVSTCGLAFLFVPRLLELCLLGDRVHLDTKSLVTNKINSQTHRSYIRFEVMKKK